MNKQEQVKQGIIFLLKHQTKMSLWGKSIYFDSPDLDVPYPDIEVSDALIQYIKQNKLANSKPKFIKHYFNGAFKISFKNMTSANKFAKAIHKLYDLVPLR
ncbi:hypothetical protein DY037_05615 [Apilactobacillus micheneri]|uniref:hypothetical protein n=1 Tax=Apilactobacillus micheneri TaxID=1899430 RepID=UPI00112CDFDC|nr:hypothetical protein [Apilactobacillus micheneri]TPR49259.1 hypothetical protein DY037_05615 [Apilactobacillus micheneri]